MSNFTFLNTNWPDLSATALEAEQNVTSAPLSHRALILRAVQSATINTRRLLEIAVKWLYANDSYLKKPYSETLAALIHGLRLRSAPDYYPVPEQLGERSRTRSRRGTLTIQKIGNLAVHSDKPISSSDSLHALKELFHALFPVDAVLALC